MSGFDFGGFARNNSYSLVWIGAAGQHRRSDKEHGFALRKRAEDYYSGCDPCQFRFVNQRCLENG